MNPTSARGVRWRRVVTVAAIAALLTVPAATTASAEPMELEVDLDHTAVMWAAGHGGFTKVHGLFRKINEAELVFDEDNVANSRVRVVVDAASLDSNHWYRDHYTRSEPFLHAMEFPTITFESTEIAQTGENTGTMTGDLTLRGVTKPVTFDVTFNGKGPHISGNYQIAGFTARTTVMRSEFGMGAFIPWVSDEVDIHIEIEGLFGKEG